VRDECQLAVEEAIGRPLRKHEEKGIEEAVTRQMRLLARQDRGAWMAMSHEEQLAAGAQAAVARKAADVQEKLRQTELHIAANDRIDNTLAVQFAALPDNYEAGDKLRIVGQLVAHDMKQRGIESTSTRADAIYAEAMGRLVDLWNADKGHFLGLFGRKAAEEAIWKETFGEDSGSAAAKKGVAAFRKVAEELWSRSNASGRARGSLGEAWHKPQSNSQYRVGDAGIEQYVKDVPQWLDRDMYLNADGSRMNDEQLENTLAHVFDTITTDGHNKEEPGENGYVQGSSDKGGQHRVLFFKDAASAMAYASKYSGEGLWDTFRGHIKAMANDIALAETWGPKDEQTFAYFNDRTRLEEERQFPTEKDSAIAKAHALNQALFDSVAGRTQIVDQRVHDWWQAARNFEVFKDLVMLPATALSDEGGMAATAFANHVPWAGGLFRQLRYLNPLSSEARAQALGSSLGIQVMDNHVNRFGSENFGGGGGGAAGAAARMTGKMAAFTLKASFMNFMWNARRSAMGSMLMSYVGKMTRKYENFADLNVHDHGVLANKGVSENDWKVWQLAQTEDWGTAAHTVITPKAIQAIPDAQLLALGDPTELRRNASTALLSHIMDEVGAAVMEQGIRERVSKRVGTTPGTHLGELGSSLMLFKGFSFAMMGKHYARAGTMPTGTDRAQYVGRLITAGTLMGAAALQLNNLAKGQDPEDMASWRFWAHAVAKGGGLGLYGEFLYSEMTQHDTSLVAALGGPLVTDAEQIFKLSVGAAIKATRGEKVDEGAKLIQFAKSSLGVPWYLKAALDHLIMNDMQEAASPGYLERMQGRAMAQRDTSWWYDPHDSAPARAPDFSKVWDPRAPQGWEKEKSDVASLFDRASSALAMN
jgi:hypothetical protein